MIQCALNLCTGILKDRYDKKNKRSQDLELTDFLT